LGYPFLFLAGRCWNFPSDRPGRDTKKPQPHSGVGKCPVVGDFKTSRMVVGKAIPINLIIFSLNPERYNHFSPPLVFAGL
jgi:hypothetical protein